MTTVKEAVTMLNEQLHPRGYHLAMVRLDAMDYKDLFGGDGNGDAEYHLMTQTYDFRYEKPDKDSYTVTLSAKDMGYIGRAVELYHRICFDRYEKEMKKIFSGLVAKMSEVFGEEAEEEPDD